VLPVGGPGVSDLAGRNGAGGRTKLQAVMGDRRPTAGSITLAGKYLFLISNKGEAVVLEATRTAPPGIASAQTLGGIDWGLIAAVSTLFVLPVVIFTFLVRNYLLRGVTFGAVRR